MLITLDLDLRVAGGGVLCDQMELDEGGEPGCWLVAQAELTPVSCSGPGRSARVAEARPGPPLSI